MPYSVASGVRRPAASIARVCLQLCQLSAHDGSLDCIIESLDDGSARCASGPACATGQPMRVVTSPLPAACDALSQPHPAAVRTPALCLDTGQLPGSHARRVRAVVLGRDAGADPRGGDDQPAGVAAMHARGHARHGAPAGRRPRVQHGRRRRRRHGHAPVRRVWRHQGRCAALSWRFRVFGPGNLFCSRGDARRPVRGPGGAECVDLESCSYVKGTSHIPLCRAMRHNLHGKRGWRDARVPSLQ